MSASLSSTVVLANPAVPLLPPVALPTNGKVVAGNATITQSQTPTSATMNVNQTSQRAVVNWDSFNVGKNATVNFNQPNASSVTLNRVTGTTASMIEGAVKANGQVIFVNPNGVTISKGAEINAAGVVASTMNIADKDFMDGKSTYKGNGTGAVINEGKIKTNVEGGYIALLAPEVRNDGYLLAKKGSGTVAMASGEQITLDFKGDSLISLKVDKSAYNALIENKRVVEVNGGLVVIAAGSANQLMASVIKNTGRISANSLVNNGGVIELVANTVTQAGKVTANSQSAQAGEINIVGNDIAIAANSKTTATGAIAGGQVNIGLASTKLSGGTQVSSSTQAGIKANADQAAQNNQLANTVTIGQNALIDTSATQTGNGGSIAIWSQAKTTVAGILKSMGGAISGNGGFIETSSKGQVSLAPSAQINTSPNNQTGKAGTWLLDPLDLTIDQTTANFISQVLANSNVTIAVTNSTTACPIGSCTQNGTSSLTIASGADILKSGNNYTILTLSSEGIFNLNANISGQNLDVIIQSSIAYLGVGTSINASKVTVQAQTIYAQGNINSSNYLNNANSGSLGNAINLLAQAIYVSGRLSANAIGRVAGTITLAANTINLNQGALVEANGDEGGQVTIAANDSLWSSAAIQVNGGNGRGGTLAITAANDLYFDQALLQANGSTDGGAITLIANRGDLIIQNSTIQTNGSTGRGGSIAISANNNVTINSTAIEATGYNQGGQILIGNDARNGTLPFALLTSIDEQSSINASQLDQSQANHAGGLIETSGHTLNLLSSINAGRGGIWLLDPTDVVINTTAGTSTGTDPLLFTNQTNISASQIQTAINSGISVQIIADGTITQTANLSFAPSSGVAVSLTYDNRTGTAKAITLTGTTTNTGAGDLTLNYLSSGQIKINGAINSTSTGKINVVAQTAYATNTLTTCSAGACASIYNGASGSITTKGGYVVMDATGGSISGTTITIGSIQNGPIYLNAGINTTTAGTSASGAGGNFSLAASANQASGIGSFEPNVATLNIGGNATFSLKNYTNASYGFVVASYASTSPITAYGNIDITSIGVSTSNYGLIYLTSALTSTTGNITLTASSTNTSATLNPGVSANASGTLTANAGAITVTSTSNASTAVSLLGAMSAKSISITGTSTTASTIVSLGAMTIVAGGSDLSVTANNTSGGANTGITQTGAITVNASGGNISFISNNIINQAGAIRLSANTSGTPSTVLYSTTTGAKTSNIIAGALTISSGSTSDVNYVAKTAGAGINPGALVIPGSVTLDNTYGGTDGVGGTPTSGYITTSNSGTLTSAITGLNINAAITADGGITLKGASQTGYYSVALRAAVTSSLGDIEISGAGINYSVYSSSAGVITAKAGAVNITGTSTTGQAVDLGAAITANTGITINGTATTATTINSIGALTLGYGYSPGDSAIPNVVSSSTGTSGSLMGSLSGSTLPTIASAGLTGGSIVGFYSATDVALQSSTATTATYIVGYANGVHTKMVQLVLTSSGGFIYATETLAKYNTTQLTSGTAANVLGGTTNILSLWSGSAGGGTGTVTSMTLATSATGGGYAAANLSLAGAGFSANAPTGNITITANNTAGGGNTGITQSGAITNNASGSNITFTSNNLITQSGAISLASNTTGNVATISYDTTAGTKASTITAGALTITSGSTSDINFVMKSAGSALNPNAIGTSTVRLPGTVTIDNTYGGTIPASGYVSTSNISTAATSSVGVTINNAIYSTKLISVKGISYASQGINYSAVINASAGGVDLTGTTYNNYGVYTSNASLITGNFITIVGRGAVAVAGWIDYIGALTVNSGATGGNIAISATGTTAGNDNGIYQSGAITGANGSDISFTSNNIINQIGAISMAANTSGNVANITYDTTAGNKSSTITAGALTITSGSTSDINFVMKSAGGALNPNLIGTSSSRLPGAVTIDNTYGGSSPASGYVTTSNITTAATGSVGVTINNAIYTTKLVSIKGISYTSQGVNYSAVINSSAGGVEITGTTYNNYGVYTGNASLITGNFITINGVGAVAVAGWIDYIGALTINSGATGGDITITATGTSAGNDSGIYQSGAISGANGSDITFTSNNVINQLGVITMAANTNAISNVTYDTTSGNRLSTISSVAISTTSGSTFAINYTAKSAGSAISVDAISVPGYINLDNTYGSASGVKSTGYFNGTNNTTSNVTGSAGVLVGGILTAGNALTIKGVSASTWAIQNSSAYTLTAGSGDLSLIGVGAHGIYQMGSLIASAGNIFVSSYATSLSWSYYAQSSVQKNYIALGNIDLISYSKSYSSALNIFNILMQTTNGNITLSARGGATGNGAVHPAIYFVTSVINAGGNFVIQGATNTGGIATVAPGTAAMNTMGDTAVHIASSASLAYGGITYTGYKAAGNISIAGTSTSSYGVYIVAPIVSTAGSVTITGTSTSGYGIASTSAGTITGATGVALYGVGSAGSITTAALVRNTGSTGGIILNAVSNASIGAVTNSGADGIRITGGNGVAAGTTTGGTIIALGTVTNTGGVVALSMASPRSANSYDVEGAIGITSSNASTDNVRYSVQGGTFTTPSTYSSGNYIDYRAGTTVYTITVSLSGNYSAAYGTAYTDSSALSWLRTNATVTLSATPFGVSAASIKAGLVWNSTIGSAGVNANAVQAGTTIVSANILAGTGQGVTLSGTSRTYTITAKALTITDLASTSNYDAVTTYASLVGNAGYSVSGLVTSIGGVAVTDAVTSVTQTIKSGSVVGSGSVISGVAQNGLFNSVPSAAVGVGLSNYSITYVGVASTVNKATITITAAADSKVYGNTTTAAGIAYSAGAASASGGIGYSITSGALLGTDTLTGVTLTSTGGAATTAVGTGISIVPSLATGSGIGNYTITYANGVMAVTARPLTITASTQNTSYGTSYALGTSAFTTSGLANTDAVSSTTLKYSGSSTVAGTTNAGTYTAGIIPSAASGTGLSNYTITYVGGNLVVATKALTITASTQNSTYGSAYSLGTSAFTTSGLVNSDAVSSTTLLYSGNATVAPTVSAATYTGGIIASAASGTGLSNYNISYIAGNLVIGKATITLAPTGATTTYNASTLSNSTYSQNTANYSITGYKNTDVAADVAIALTGSMAFSGSASTVVKNAATYALTVGTLAGTTTNGNYQIAFANPASNTYLINPATLTVSASKDYDGSQSFAANRITVTTGIGTQTVVLTGTATANSSNVTGVSSLSTTGLSLGDGANGGLAANYVLPASTSSVVIRPLAITASIAGSPTKVYDATTNATLAAGDYSLSGFIAGQGASVSQTLGAYNYANATSNTSYSPATSITAALIPSHFTANVGTNLSNYTLPTTATGSATITTAPLTLRANSYAAFAGQSPSSFAGTVTGVQGSDSISVSVSQSPSGTTGIYTLTPAAVMSAALVGNYGTPTVVTGTYTEAQQYQLVVSATSASNAYGVTSNSSSANSVVNLVAQYCTVSSNCTSGTIVTLTVAAPSATASQITTSSLTTPTWVATDAAANAYSIKVASNASLGFSAGNFLNAGSYTLTPSGASNATISGATNPVIYLPGTQTVTPLNVTVTNNSAPTKVYDATTALTSGVSLTPSNKLAGDNLSLSGSGVYSSKNVGTTAYTITSVALGGADAGNYRYIGGDIAASNGSIYAAPITISGLAASNKVYDAGLAAVIIGTPTAQGALGSDTVTVSGTATAGSFATANVATGIAVTPTLTNLSLSDSNYQITGVTTALSANITVAPITATINKVYNGSTLVANGDIAITGVAGQTLVLSAGTATLTNPNVGSATLSSLNGATLANGTGLASNYTLTNPVGVVTITPAALSISASNAVKVYDTDTAVSTATTAPAATVASGTLYTNSVTGYTDSLSGGSFSYASSAAGSGNKTLNVSGVSILNDTTSAAANYSITYVANTTSTISQAPVTISGLSASNKVYDTGVSATITGTPTAYGVLGSDVVTVSGSAASGSFASANVGTAIAVTPVISGLSLSNANYSITGITSPLTANITAAPITISGLSASNKVYDTGVSATITGTPTAYGVLGSDVVTVSGSAASGSFASANVGTAIAVTPVISGLSLSNANYSITGITSPLTANITAAPVTVTASAQSTVYGTPLALGSADFTTSGLLGSDAIASVTLTQLGNTTVPGTQNAGTYSDSVNGILPSAASGTNLSNYQITYAPGTLTITRKSINVVADNASMTYADSNLPTLTYQSVSGLINGDQMSGSLATSATAYSGVAGSASNVGSYYITQGTVTAGSNYDISYTRASLTINPANLYVTAQNQSTTYGSLLVLPQSGSAAYSTLGLRNGDYVSAATLLYSGNQTIPGTTNAGTYSASVDVSTATGLGMGNYTISYVPGNLTIAKAVLTVTAADSAKFVGMSDPSGYGGVIYSGFKNSDSSTSGALGSAVISVSRSNTSENNAGSYAGVLTPNISTDLTNYTVAYVPGKFTIVGANQLLVQVGSNSTVYGTAPSYSAGTMTVSYCTDCAPGISSPNIVSILSAGITVSGSSLNIVTGNTTATLALAPVNPVLNSSGTQLTVGTYSLAASGTSIASSSGPANFNAVTVIGGLGVTPLALSYADLGITGVTQVYNGSVNMSNISLSAASGVLSGDSVAVSATGTFASKNVGINIPYTVGIALSGVDAGNYQMNGGSSFTGTNGVITQLNSVTYTGSNTGGNWSNPSNWTTTGTSAVGAIPDLSNVANVILPSGSTVIYDDSVQGPVTSAVANSGNLRFNLSSNSTIQMPISGTGTVTVAGSGVITLTGNSSYTGATILNEGSSLIAGSNNALGAGLINSNGTPSSPANFSTTSGVILPALNVVGGSTALLSDITTSGTQTYSGSLIIGPSGAGTTTLSTSNANILVDASINGAVNKTESLVINAGSGVVTLGSSIGNVARLNNLTVTGSRIYILADVLTGVAQTYNGAIYIGDASYLGRTASTGFLFTNNYNGYFQYVAANGVSASTISYLDLNPIYVRTMISEDPSITYNGTVNDTVANTHTLLVAAIAPAVIASSSGYAAVNGGASISFNAAVGGIDPLYSLNAQTVVSNTQANAATTYVGTVSLVNSVTTYSDQTYRANLMSSQSSSQPGGVTFSIWDPASRLNFNLPLQTVANSGCSSNCGQLNLQNPNSLDTLTLNGRSNFNTVANLTGVNNWGSSYVQNEALGYIAAVTPVTPAVTPRVGAPMLEGGMLREALDFHADQVQMTVDERALIASVSISAPVRTEVIRSSKAVANTLIKKDGGDVICTADAKGDLNCGD